MDIFIDTNALTLLILGSVNLNYIESHRRLSIYSVEDFELLSRAIGADDRVVTVPNVWTEVDNLCNSLNGPDREVYVALFRKVVLDSVEKFVSTSDAVRSNYFLPIGLTDSIILSAAQECDFLVTGDSDLAGYAGAMGIEVLDLKLEANRKFL